MSFDGPLGEHELVGDGPVGKPGADQFGYLPFPARQWITRPDGVLQLLGELLGPVGRTWHIETIRLEGGLPGKVQGLRQVAAGRARLQRAGPVQPGERHEGPGPDAGVDGDGVLVVADRIPGAAKQRGEPWPSGQCSEPDRNTTPVPVAPESAMCG